MLTARSTERPSRTVSCHERPQVLYAVAAAICAPFSSSEPSVRADLSIDLWRNVLKHLLALTTPAPRVCPDLGVDVTMPYNTVTKHRLRTLLICSTVCKTLAAAAQGVLDTSQLDLHPACFIRDRLPLSQTLGQLVCGLRVLRFGWVRFELLLPGGLTALDSA